MKNITLLGSTGSIGAQVLDVVSRLPERLRVVGMAAHRNVGLLADQVREFRPSLVSIGTREDAVRLRELLTDFDSQVIVADPGDASPSNLLSGLREVGGSSALAPSPWPSPARGRGDESGFHSRGREDEFGSAAKQGDHLVITWGEGGLEWVATHPEAETAVVSVAGTVGLAPTLAAISAGKDIALASKEVLVAAGSIVDRLVRETGVRLLPIDSEHSAVFQCLQGEDKGAIRRVLLTASGGALREIPVVYLGGVTVQQALAHPNWSMGRKITIDSATLMNKVLEIIEARWLFGVDASRIEVVIHPQSIVHSMVEFEDGSVMAQLGVPDMRTPIQYALLYPERIDTELPRLNLVEQGKLTFEEPDPERYPGLALAYRALEQGGTMPAVLNAANEVAVALFLDKKIRFLDIVRIVQEVMDSHSPACDPDLRQILEADAWAREAAIEKVEADIG